MNLHVGNNDNNQWTGPEDVYIDRFDEASALVTAGSGSVTVHCTLPKNASITKQGSGNLVLSEVDDHVTISRQGRGNCRIQGNVGSYCSFTTSGSGDVLIQGNVGSDCSFKTSGSGNVLIQGNIGPRAHFFQSGSGQLHFKGTLCEDIEFPDGLHSPVCFDKKPSPLILEKVQAAQTQGLTASLQNEDGWSTHSDDGYSLKIKNIANYFFIQENENRYAYQGQHFSWQNEQWFIDGRQVHGAVAKDNSNKNENTNSFFSKIDRFSREHPFLFLAATLGLGLFWYAGKALVKCFQKPFGISYVSSGMDLHSNFVVKENSTNCYLTETEVNKILMTTWGITLSQSSSSANMLKQMPSSSPSSMPDSGSDISGKPLFSSPNANSKEADEKPEGPQANAPYQR